MKKRWLPLLALFLLLAGCTGSCGSEDVTGTAQPGQSELPEVSASPVLSPAPVESEDATPVTPTAEPSAEPSAAPTPTPVPETSSTPAPVDEGPTDEEVLEAYRS